MIPRGDATTPVDPEPLPAPDPAPPMFEQVWDYGLLSHQNVCDSQFTCEEFELPNKRSCGCQEGTSYLTEEKVFTSIRIRSNMVSLTDIRTNLGFGYL